MHTSPRTSKQFRIKTGITVLFFGLSIFLLDPHMAVPCVLAAAFHECGHLLSGKLLHIPISEMKLDLFGAHISVSSALIPYRSEFLLCASGPFFSFLLTLLLSFPIPCQNEFLRNVSNSSLFLGLLNLLPVRGFDGGRMLSAFLSAVFSPRIADTAEHFFTGIFLIFLWGISVYLLLITGGGLTLFVFSTGLFSKVFLT